ncbi:RNA polymerase sigma factor [Virgibacillus kekensis]|uniref:RNA polymerase sigma factor n=1 Tax=Virgibacillus kekensis TaxID=202261 RepID=A0ABV9DLH4_9BACI
MTNSEMITDWFRKYSDDVFNFLIYYTGQRDVEDIVQEVFIKALRKVDTFNDQSSPKTWLFSIARNLAVDEIRKQTREKEKVVRMKVMMDRKPLETPEQVYQLSETNKEIYRGIGYLKRSYQEVLILRGIQELTVNETAQVLKWNKNRVKVTYHRALKALEKKLGGLVNE